MELSAKCRRLTFWVVTLGSLFVGISSVSAQSLIKYLPHNEDMDSVIKEFPESPKAGSRVLTEILCDKGAIFQQAADCYRCIQEWLPCCHPCCIDTVNKVVKCTDSPCQSPLFPGSGCDCKFPSLVSPNGTCAWADNEQAWYCAKDNLQAKQGCLATMQKSLLKDKNACDISEFYTSAQIDTDPAATTKECPKDIGSPCFKYVPSDELDRCKVACDDYNGPQSACEKDKESCKDKACTPQNCSGSTCGRHLYDSVCAARQACVKIAESLKNPDPNTRCSYDNKSLVRQCAEISNRAIDCFLKEKGCSGCFEEIDKDFFYKFVAKSRESETVIWEIGSQPLITGIPVNEAAPAFYLYTRIKVFEAGNPEPIYESPIHQKYLGAAFSIFCAGHIDKDKLKQGKAYYIRLYYFLPESLQYDLKVQINNLRLILVRIRE